MTNFQAQANISFVTLLHKSKSLVGIWSLVTWDFYWDLARWSLGFATYRRHRERRAPVIGLPDISTFDRVTAPDTIAYQQRIDHHFSADKEF
jgi:hypothetical protein